MDLMVAELGETPQPPFISSEEYHHAMLNMGRRKRDRCILEAGLHKGQGERPRKLSSSALQINRQEYWAERKKVWVDRIPSLLWVDPESQNQSCDLDDPHVLQSVW